MGFSYTLLPFMLLVVLLEGVSGCAVTVPITTRPPGAKVRLDNMEIGKTPLAPSISFLENHVVELELEGYLRERVDLISIPYNLAPNYIDMALQPLPKAPVEVQPTKTVPPGVELGLPEAARALFPPAGATPGSLGTAWLLERLAQAEKLYQEGVIQEDEYKALRYGLLLNALLSPGGTP